MSDKTPNDEGYKAFRSDRSPNRENPYLGSWSSTDLKKAMEWREGWNKAADNADRCCECGQLLPLPPGVYG